ncbi:MAG TPA: aldehyde ferredoxin oxidoreductase family protein [Methylomirabilota bacterium]|jgi:aldehyde:ferredoxin oxidoreductase|nr:aldehyde ferredoxin oxidoreductase family protein [Methylomirabilota bacterium]
MMYGWTGTVLRINLTTRTAAKEPLHEEWARDYIGGRGLGARYLLAEVDPKVDPFSPDNKLLVVTGPLTGTNASCGSRYMVVTKGPLTNAITTSNSGGSWGPELKAAGYDMLILEGRASSPCYLWIYNDQVEIRDASHLWGKTVWETEEQLKTELGVPDTVIASIGPAGEKLVRFACIMNDLHRAAGRSGVGAVMGSKNLKAIAVRGTGGVRLADPKAYMEAQWAMKTKLRESPVTSQGLPIYGTEVLVNVINEHGALPTRNHQQTVFEQAENISGETLTETRLVSNKACFACTIACGRVATLPGDAAGKYMVTTHPHNWKIAGEGPEYEAAWAMGAECGVGDLDALIKANWLCNELGMDAISFGTTVAAAMELYEKGVVSQTQTGIPLNFGSGEALIAMAEKVAYREGFGTELAEGSKRMTEKFGRPELFMGVRGQEFAAYEARAIQGMGLGYATSNRGACHLKAYTVAAEILGLPRQMDPRATEGKAEITKLFQDATATVDATGLCQFLTFGVGLEEILPQLSAATGVAYTMEDLLKIGERIWNLERLWNERSGMTGKEDTLPKRILEEPIPSGPAKGQVNRLGEMLPEYYRLRGWTADGRITPEKLQELGLA